MSTLYYVRTTPRASKDVHKIIEYIRQSSPQNALTVFESLWYAIRSLDQNPQRYSVYQNRRNAKLAVHKMPVPPFLIYYRIDETAMTVRVITVRHGARRQPKRFK